MATALAALSGVLMWTAYPNIDLWPMIFVAWVPLLLALRGPHRARRRFFLGWLAGTVFTTGSHYFIAETLVNLGGLPRVAAMGVFLLYAAYHGVLFGLFALGYSVLRRHGGRYLWLLSVPVFYALLERHFPVWFQAYASNVLWKVPVLVQSLELIGPSGLSALVILVSCALAALLETPRPWSRRAFVVPGVVLALWVGLGLWGSVRMDQVRAAPVSATARVTMIQPNMTVAEKRSKDGSGRLAAWDRTTAMTRAALAEQPDLMVWPEGAFPYIYDKDAYLTPQQDPELLSARYSRHLHDFARELGLPFVAAGLRREQGRIRNSAFFFQPGVEGSVPYDKRKLVLLAEHVPFGDEFPALVKALPGASHHAPGERFEHYEAAGLRWVPSMCYEAVFPTITREALAHGDGGQVLLNLTNDVWFGNTSEGNVHLMMQVPRTIENRVWLVRATNSGVSAIVDPTGTLVAATGQDEQTVVSHTLTIRALPPTFYHRYGDLLFALSCLIGAAGTALRWWRARRAQAASRRYSTPSKRKQTLFVAVEL